MNNQREVDGNDGHRSHVMSYLEGGQSQHVQSGRIIYLNNSEKNAQQRYLTNYISTTKYTRYSFVPLGLIYQFLRFSNCYFMFVTILQCIPVVSPLHPITAINPMVFVLCLALLREGYEDYQRYKTDKAQNSLLIRVNGGNQSQFTETTSDTLKVGDFVLMKEGETFPADLAVIATSNKGDCFIKTSSLDGEKNLKKRFQIKGMDKFVTNNDLQAASTQAFALSGRIECGDPNKNLHKLDGGIYLDNKETFALCEQQLLLKGAQLQNTEWAIAICIYTGIETKIMLNSQAGRVKMSHLEHRLNTLVMIICALQAVLCTLMAIGCKSFLSNTTFDDLFAMSVQKNPDDDFPREVPYEQKYSDSAYSVINFFTYFLLLNTLLPISLQVCMEFCKFFQAFYINNDVLMFSWERNKLVECKSMPLVEELGQVSYIFSDKTGTLTRNVMEFKYMLIGEKFYGDEAKFQQLRPDQGEDERDAFKRQQSVKDVSQESENQWQDEKFDRIVQGEDNFEIKRALHSKNQNQHMTIQTQKDLVFEFMKILSLAHSCEVEQFKDKNGNTQKFYNGPSPDEVALVEFASSMQFDCFKSDEDFIEMQIRKGDMQQYTKFKAIEFTSDRKRMSVLIHDPNDDKIKLLVKGADSIIKARLGQLSPEQNKATEEFLDTASKQGLRTLLMAMKVIDESEKDSFLEEVKQASMAKVDKEKLLDDIFDKFEQDLQLIGATAVEDRLQDDVPQTIASLQEAGIKIWMLTGDKLETAENIGESCKLLQPNQGMIIERISDEKDVKSFCSDKKVKWNQQRMKEGKKLGVLVEARALTALLLDPIFKLNFLKICKTSEAVICCRVSPGQKADVVRLIKEDDPEIITLSIGDGANDVSMIKEAHIGVGLYGNEGMSAVQSSDFALGEFKFLWRLLMHHGRLNYMRNAELVLYFFYKNLVLTAPHVYFAGLNGFSGQTIYDDFYISFFNLFHTSWPLTIKTMFEQDISYELDGGQMRKFYPSLYYIGAKNTIFNWPNYFYHNLLGLIHSIIIFYVPVLIFQESLIMGQMGQSVDMSAINLTSFTCLFGVVTMRLCLLTRWWTWANFFFYSVMSICVYILFMWVQDFGIPDSNIKHSALKLHGSPLFWLTVLLVVGFSFCADCLIEYVSLNFFTTGSDYVRQYVRKHKGYGWNDPNMEIEVTASDVQAIREFMGPINERYRLIEMEREIELSKQRDVQIKKQSQSN